MEKKDAKVEPKKEEKPKAALKSKEVGKKKPSALPKKEKKEEDKLVSYQVDCSVPVNDKVFKADELLQYFKKRVKVNGKIPTKDSPVVFTKDADKLIKVTAPLPFAKRYIKYLTKKFLKKHEIRDYLHVVANTKNSYQVKYFKIENEEA
jgi:large subunit ribosomal protein L22e